MKKAILIGAVVIGALVVLALFLPAIDDILYPNAGVGGNLDVAFYDKDGNQVGSMAFVRVGDTVEDIIITLSYTVASSSPRFEENLEVWGSVLIEWTVGSPGAEYQTAFDLPISESRLATSSYQWPYDLREIITVDETGKYYGWGVRITATLTAQTRMEDDEIVTSVPWTEVVNFSLSWESDSLTISGVLGG